MSPSSDSMKTSVATPLTGLGEVPVSTGVVGNSTTRPRMPDRNVSPPPGSAARAQEHSARASARIAACVISPGWTGLGPVVFLADQALVRLGLERGHVRQVPVLLGEVEPVPDHEHRGNLEAFVADIDVDPLDLGLLHERAHLEAGRTAGPKVLEQVRQRQPRVDDVLDQQDVLVLDVVVEVLQDANHAGGLGGRPVRRDRHEVEPERQADVPGQVRHHHEGAFQHAHEEEILAAVVLGDPVAELADLGLDLVAGDQDPVDVLLELGHVAEKCIGRPGGHGSPFLRGLRGEEMRTYPFIRSASKSPGRSSRLPVRPTARSSTPRTCADPDSGSHSPPMAAATRRADSATRVATPRGSATSRSASSRTSLSPITVTRAAASDATASRWSASSLTSSAVRARVALTFRPSADSRAGSASLRIRLRRKRGSRFVGSVRGRSRRARQNALVSAAVTSRSGRTPVTPSGGSRVTAGMPATASSPPPRASPSSTVSAWSSRVCPRAARSPPSSPTTCVRAPYRASRAQASTDAPRGGRSAAVRPWNGRPSRSACRATYAASRSDPGRSR